jgi:hypothetical protein
MHVWFGRFYILLMLWCTASSLLIHNTGLPIPVLFSFLYALGGLSIGWLVIKLYQSEMDMRAADNVQRIIKRHGLNGDLGDLLLLEKCNIAKERTWSERVSSWKTLHGVFMTTSFVNIFGRLTATNPGEDFACYTYPVYKQIDTPAFQGSGKAVTFVPTTDPDYDKLPWAGREGIWVSVLGAGPILVSFVFGIIYSCFAAKMSRRNVDTSSEGLGDNGERLDTTAEEVVATPRIGRV